MKKTITLLALFACTYAKAQEKPAVIEITKTTVVTKVPVEEVKKPAEIVKKPVIGEVKKSVEEIKKPAEIVKKPVVEEVKKSVEVAKPVVEEIKKPAEDIKPTVKASEDTTTADVEISKLNAKLKLAATQKLATQQLQGARLTEAKHNLSKNHYQISWIKGNFGGRIHFDEAKPGVFTYVQNATEVAENEIPLIIPADVRGILKKIIPKAVTYQWLRRELANGHKNYSTDFLIDGVNFYFAYNVFGAEKHITIRAKSASLIEFIEDETFTKILILTTPTAVINASDKIDAYIKSKGYDVTKVQYAVHAQIAKKPTSQMNDEKYGDINLNVTADVKGHGRLVFHYKQATPETITETKAAE